MFFFITAKNMGSHFSAVPLCRPSSGLKRSVLTDPLQNHMTDLFSLLTHLFVLNCT